MRIVHFSDVHGTIPNLPEADLYICTGDVLPNTKLCLWPNKEPEMQIQDNWIDTHKEDWANAFASKEAPLIIVRGNHDFVDLQPLFDKRQSWSYEFTEKPSMFDFNGWHIGGFRGVPPINDIWADEISENAIDFRLRHLSNLDILLTHGPGFQLLDEGYHYGSKAIRDFVKDPANAGLHHFFGHCHGDGGNTFDDGHCFFSNAATKVNVLDINKRRK